MNTDTIETCCSLSYYNCLHMKLSVMVHSVQLKAKHTYSCIAAQ